MDHILVERRVIYRYKHRTARDGKGSYRWKYIDTYVTLTPDVSEDPALQARLQKHLSEDAEVLFIGPPREIYEGVRWGMGAFNVTRGEVRHLIGPR